MNNWIEPINVIEVVKSFCMANDGDESTTDIIVSMGAALLDVSEDEMMDIIKKEI